MNAYRVREVGNVIRAVLLVRSASQVWIIRFTRQAPTGQFSCRLNDGGNS
ncbi:hypothetical protein THTE_0215 [Thermogutta terrifontis]|uniref:Uncharacterized protein n=1 Tax=Thermogutta terrifontis TaxID=1331910 RepID=A0A286RA62_9BACT|nr:hypothetical protein THTE_0215 [Thermogutta terrifontis]